MAPNPLGELIVAAARDAFTSRKRSKIVVPEWKVTPEGGEPQPVAIWYDPVPPEEYYELINWRREDGPHYAAAHVVATKATDEKGDRLFTAEHEIIFCKMVDAGPIIRIANAILGVTSPAAVEKN